MGTDGGQKRKQGRGKTGRPFHQPVHRCGPPKLTQALKKALRARGGCEGHRVPGGGGRTAPSTHGSTAMAADLGGMPLFFPARLWQS